VYPHAYCSRTTKRPIPRIRNSCVERLFARKINLSVFFQKKMKAFARSWRAVRCVCPPKPPVRAARHLKILATMTGCETFK